MKIVINKCYGGFGLSHEAVKLYFKLKKWKLHAYVTVYDKQKSTYKKYNPKKDSSVFGLSYFKIDITGLTEKQIWSKKNKDSYWSVYDLDRSDPTLIKVIEKLGEEKASGNFSELRIVEIPDGIEYSIEEYDGVEWISENHRTWG